MPQDEMIWLLPHYHEVSLTTQQNWSTHRGNFYWEMRAFPLKLWLGRSAFVSYPWLRSTWREPWYINPLPLCPLVCSFISEYMTWFILNHRFRRNGVWVPFFLFGNHTADVLGIMQLCLASFKESATREGAWGSLSRLSGPADDVWNGKGESF